MAELVKTTDDLRRAYLSDQVIDNVFAGTAYHAVVLVSPAVIEYWIVTP